MIAQFLYRSLRVVFNVKDGAQAIVGVVMMSEYKSVMFFVGC